MSNDNKKIPGQQQPHSPSQDNRDKHRQDQGAPKQDQKNWNPSQDKGKERK